MENLTEDGNHTTVQQLFCPTGLYGVHLKIFISAFNIPLCITAFLGNVLIIAALKKVRLSLHPPSKLLFGCLASTDLCVGLITQPLYVTYLMSPQHSKCCYYAVAVFITLGLIFCGVSLLTLTAISVDRLLALLMGLRYRQVVTSRRAWGLVATFWLLCVSIPFIPRVQLSIALIILLLCILTSTVCYIKIYLTLRHHRAQVQDHVNQGQPNGGGISLNIARYRKTVSSALWVQMTLLACYLPLGIMTVLSLIGGSFVRTQSSEFTGAVIITLFLSNSSLNPFLYCWKMREVRRAVKDTIKQFRCFSS
ncbi:hypothetical protein ACROYT_G033741 [Oculina patagonica]